MYQLKKTEVTCICDNVYVLTDRAGCCVNLVVGKEKALVFDTGSGTDDIHGLVRKMTGLPLVVRNIGGYRPLFSLRAMQSALHLQSLS